MLKEFVDRILELARPVTQEVDGRTYSTVQLHPVLEPAATPLKFHSLTGLVAYLEKKFDQDPGESCRIALHVHDHSAVSIISEHIGKHFRRHEFASAGLVHPGFRFGEYMGQENFLIALQALFVQDEVTAELLRVCGSITAEESIKLEDDGRSQRVTAKAGIVRQENVVLPNPVTLRPFRTFREVDQPASKFILRVQRSEQGPRLALFEADGQVWQLKAIETIREWLEAHVPGVPVLA